MDAYLVKPVRTVRRTQPVEGLAMPTDNPDSRARQSAAATPSAAPLDSCAASAFDFEAALARLDHDRAFFANLVEFFLEDYPGLVAQIRQAIQAGDTAALGHAAHSLKGLAGNFDAHPTTRIAARLEKAGFDADLPAAQASIESLEHEIARLHEALLPYRAAAGDGHES